MNDSFKGIFTQVKAEDELKDRTMKYLAEKTHEFEGSEIKKPVYYRYAACVICVLIMFLGGYWLYFTPVAEISIDINPSIELSVNRFDRVISVNDFNEDGKILADSIDVKYKNYSDAIKEVMSNDMICDLLSGNEILTFTVAGSNESKSAEMLLNVKRCTEQSENTFCYNSSSEDADAAHDLGLSCGKYRAYAELHQLDPSVTPEEVQSMTMREIRERINSYSSDIEYNTSSDKPQNQTTAQHNHNGGNGKKHKNKQINNN